MKSDTNLDFNKYVQKKIIDRLAIMAQYCPRDMNPSDVTNLKQRGAHIFGPEERDVVQSAKFLILLLDCIEKWAQQFPTDETTGQPTSFSKAYEELKLKKYAFPSQAQAAA